MSLQNIQMIILPTPGPATSHLWRVICAGGAVHLLKASQDPASPDNLSPHGISPCAQRAWAFISPSRQPQQRNMIIMGFFLRFFFLFESQNHKAQRGMRERQRERGERERGLPSPKWPQYAKLSWYEIRVQEFLPDLPCVCKETEHLSHPLLLF